MSRPVEHALLSASSAHRWTACTPSARFEESFPEQKSPYADEGSLAHRYAELMLGYYYLNLISEIEFKREEKQIQASEYYNAEFKDHVLSYVDYVHSVIVDIKKVSKHVIVKLEYRVDYSAYVPEGFGTSDVIIITENEIVVIDLKFGQGIRVSAKNNPQPRLYALGAYDEFSALFDIKKITMIIVQPRLDDHVSIDTLGTGDLIDWAEQQLKPKAEQAYRGKGTFCVGEHCQFCRGKIQCRARAEHNFEIMKHDFADPCLLSDLEIADVLDRIDELKHWANSIEEYAYEKALAGRKWPGWKLVAGRSNRKIKDEKKATELLKNEGYSEDQIVKTKLVGIGDLEKLVGKKKLEDLLKGMIIKPGGKPVLVRESDERPEINSVESAIRDFSE